MWTTYAAIFCISSIVCILSYAAITGNSTWNENEKVSRRVGCALGLAVGVGVSVIWTLVVKAVT